jgi:tellurite resistance protein
MAANRKKPTKEKLAEFAEAVRKGLEFRSQDAVFQIAVEIGYLAAKADGSFDDAEKKAIVDAVDILSKGTVIELEVESIIAEADAGDADAAALGEKLKGLEQAEAGLMFGAFVAQATHGIDKDERKVLREVGKAAGLKAAKIRAILKVVGAEAPEAEAE